MKKQYFYLAKLVLFPILKPTASIDIAPKNFCAERIQKMFLYARKPTENNSRT